jgi:hypothetical protein
VTQLDLFAELPPILRVRWDTPGEGPKPYDKLVRRQFPGFEDILYDMRIGSTWHRAVMTTAGDRGDTHICIGSYAEPADECDPVWMTLVAMWEFDLETPPSQVARAIIDGADPVWTWRGK